jgi:hypothetical protein
MNSYLSVVAKLEHQVLIIKSNKSTWFQPIVLVRDDHKLVNKN